MHLPTASTLSLVNHPHLHTPTHQALLLNAPPLESADSRRFVISQLPPAQRDRYLSAFHVDHVCRVREAIEILDEYIKKHEIVDLRDYDFKGRVVRKEHGKRGREEGGEGAEAEAGTVHGEFFADDEFSDATTDSEPHHEVNYDFTYSLCGLSLDIENSIFGSTGIFEAPEATSELSLSLSPTPTPAPSIPSSPMAQTSTIFTPFPLPAQLSPLPPSRRSTPPPLALKTSLPPTTTTNTTTQSSLLPTATATTYTTHATLSIANLIHHHPPEPMIPITSLPSTDTSEEPDVMHLLSKIYSTTANPLTTLYNQDHSPNQQPQQNLQQRLPQKKQTSTSPTKTSNSASILRQAQALAMPPIPLGHIRAMKFPRIRRRGADRDRERGGSGDGGGEKQMSRKHSRSASVSQTRGKRQRETEGEKERENEQEKEKDQTQERDHQRRKSGFLTTDKPTSEVIDMMGREGRGEGALHTHEWKATPNLSTEPNTRVHIDRGERARIQLPRHYDHEYSVNKQPNLNPQSQSQSQWRSNLLIPPSTYNAMTWSSLETKPETGGQGQVQQERPPQEPQQGLAHYHPQQTTNPGGKRKYHALPTDDNNDDLDNNKEPPTSHRRITPYSWTHSPTPTRTGDFFLRDQDQG